ncbi:hypothetical protein B0181_06510 [Moraxella caviae]|uniref:Ribonuclease VapC n=1 Tax=Moraxella caviae TaxID=34060 RepID=A0A1T0A1Q8_9GAMM|nr:type II toxin-antitoxin system VapC family toxin [Moraxella caviae]OOR89615.1 hypothetical protein B0181_06510 [Moraxella caviae]STZ10302.1 PIN domain [Moraxella caviae]
MLIDTDVLIWLAKNNANAQKLLLNQHAKYLSAVTYMEMLQGMRNKQEMHAFLKHLPAYNYNILPINEQISQTACQLVADYALSHAMQMGDALIASTALHHGLPLFSANHKHFGFIDGLQLQKFCV